METQFFNQSNIMMKAMRDANFSKLKDNQLLDYHRKCHMLYAGNIKHKPINKKFVNSIVNLHDTIVSEMEKRNMKHNTPLKRV
jgi:hypothetical protein